LLIVPLHRALSRANFPLISLLLILANCVVYAFLQSGDQRVYERAADYYAQAQLGKIEFPAYLEWLHGHDHDAQRLELAQSVPAPTRVALIQSDEAFLSALHADEIITPEREEYAQWHDQRAQFDRIWDSAFTAAHELRFSHFEPARMFSAMFLHGGLEHLIGNMIFLAVLGLLVEGALGAGWYLLLYLAGGLGAQLVSLAWRWGEHGTALGASGAIAALMGAYCVLWGMRKVRVFYWFFIVFDYVRVPALVLLPVWFGWQVFNLWFNRGAHVGFDAHAGGILAGAVLALAFRRGGLVRTDFIAEDARAEQREHNVAAFDHAMAHIGKLEIAQARTLLERIDADEPGKLRVLVALYRCARYGGSAAQLDAAAARVLGSAAKTEDDIRELKNVYDDYAKACAGAPRLASEALLRLVTPWLRIGQDEGAENLLRDIAARTPQLAALPAAWFALAMRAPEGSTQRRARLQHLVHHHAHSDFAPKAQFLLQQG
jgi:membrane associated rhomboid family serine protease